MRYKSKEEWNQVHQAVIAARATGLSFDAACRQAGVPMGSYYNYLQRNGIKKPKKNKAKQPITNGHFEEYTRVAKQQVEIRVGKIILLVPPEILPETLRSLSTMGGGL